MKTITIFTPTFNRAYILPQLYNSLCQQTKKDFVWLIVDDGSTDNTHQLIMDWMNENIINIEYFVQENGGKMRAHNKGVVLCETDFFMCVDSDDYVVNDCIESILSNLNDVYDDSVCGIIAYRGNIDGSPLINEFPKVNFSSLSDLYKSGFRGDTSLVFKTSVLKEFLFPEIDGEKFIPEGYVYNQIDRKYKYKLLEKPLIICVYRDDGYTKNIIKYKYNNPIGYMLLSRQEADYAQSLIDYLKYSYYENGYKRLSKKKYKMPKPKHRIIYFLSYLLSIKYKYIIIREYKKYVLQENEKPSIN